MRYCRYLKFDYAEESLWTGLYKVSHPSEFNDPFECRGKYIDFEESLPNGKTKEYEWIAELKPLHVQHMSEHVGREFSHVGMTESEWLRLQVDR
jgi:hypothetical protein